MILRDRETVARRRALRRHIRRNAGSLGDRRAVLAALQDDDVFDDIFDGIEEDFVSTASDRPFLDRIQEWLDFLIENQDKIKQLIEFFSGLFGATAQVELPAQ